MNGKITLERHNVNTRGGRDYICRYFWNGIEIAKYSSKNDVIYLKAEYLDSNRETSYMDRMRNAKNPEMWEDLIEFLDITDDTSLSGYLNV